MWLFFYNPRSPVSAAMCMSLEPSVTTSSMKKTSASPASIHWQSLLGVGSGDDLPCLWQELGWLDLL